MATNRLKPGSAPDKFAREEVLRLESEISTETTRLDSEISRIDGLLEIALACPFLVGDYYLTENTTTPAERWPGTTWEKVGDRALIGSSLTYPLGSEGGAASISLSASNLPSHRHRVDDHTHDRGTFDITGRWSMSRGDNKVTEGAFYATSGSQSRGRDGNGWYDYYVSFQASRTWTGVSGGSTPYTDYQGSGTAFSLMSPYRAINIYRRIS